MVSVQRVIIYTEEKQCSQGQENRERGQSRREHKERILNKKEEGTWVNLGWVVCQFHSDPACID